MFKKENTALERLDYIFCSDAYLLELNKAYLKHDTYTDIITFPLSIPPAPVISDIYISVDRVKENASALRTTFNQELHRVIFHGALHLCGYIDKSKSDQKLMREKEDSYLNSYFVSRETL
jgi:probable rRNA maturation factor